MKRIKNILLNKSSNFILKHPKVFLVLYKIGIIKAKKEEVEEYLKDRDNKNER